MWTYSVNLDAVQFHQVLVADSLEYLELLRYILNRSCLTRLNCDLFHGHQFTRRVVDSCVHLSESSLADLEFKRKTMHYRSLLTSWSMLPPILP